MLISYTGNCCTNPFHATYQYKDSRNTLLDVYPHLKSIVLPEKIKELSPRFTNLYEQSYTAEQNGHIELAGSGYRNSIEILIKDFAIHKLNVSEAMLVKCLYMILLVLI